MFELLLLLYVTIANGSPSKSYIEVEAGKAVILPCTSNRGDSFFSFWELASKEVISPGNNYNSSQYEYEVLTGRLHIFNTKAQQQGLYTCVSRSVDDTAIVELSTVFLFVKEGVLNHSKMLNVIGILVLIGCGVVLVVGSYLVYKKWKQKRRIRRLLDDIEDVSNIGEEENEDLQQYISLNSPSTSQSLLTA